MATEGKGLVKPVHARVRGRVRLEVCGLYRCRRLQQVLETALAEVEGVQAVQASVLTGRLLVNYTPQTSLAAIVALVESNLDGNLKRKSPGRFDSRFGRLRALPVLNGFAALMRHFSSSPSPVQTFGMTAGLPVTLRGLVGPKGKVFGLDHFGYSAPYTVLDEKFGFTGDNVYEQVLAYLKEYK